MGRHSKAVKLVGGVRDGFALLDDDECRWAIEAGERYIDDGIGFFRGTARPGTALMVAYVDEFRDRFRAGIGRGRVTSVMWEPGIRGVRRGRTPVTTKPAKGTDGLVHHSDHGAQYISLVCTTRVGEFGMLPSTGTVGDSYDNAMAESADGAYKTELVWRRKPFQDLRDLELATFRWVS